MDKWLSKFSNAKKKQRVSSSLEEGNFTPIPSTSSSKDLKFFCVFCEAIRLLLMNHWSVEILSSYALDTMYKIHALKLPSFVYDWLGSSSQVMDWAVPHASKLKYTQLFNTTDRTRSGFLNGVQARNIMMASQLPQNVLAQIWGLADMDTDGRLSCEEFVLAMHLCDLARSGEKIPVPLPADLVPPSLRRQRQNSIPSTAEMGDPLAGMSGVVHSGVHESDLLSPGDYIYSFVLIDLLVCFCLLQHFWRDKKVGRKRANAGDDSE
ncbi:Intersectin 1 (SH3 domain protein) [Homalodisca vitripennis]|nr:Intersectin 1 (SH3 domain protein) [Homalodisca vitripennis]